MQIRALSFMINKLGSRCFKICKDGTQTLIATPNQVEPG
jgi:hypothetical protein